MSQHVRYEVSDGTATITMSPISTPLQCSDRDEVDAAVGDELLHLG